MSNTTKANFLTFLDTAPKKGLVPLTTVRVWKAGATAALENIGDNEDVVHVDVKAELDNYSSNNPSRVSPDTLQRYKSWTVAAIANFKKYTENPTAYKAWPALKTKSKRELTQTVEKKALTTLQFSKLKKPDEQELYVANNIQAQAIIAKDNAIPVTFPLRTNFRVQIILPEDMTTIEAKRIARFVMSYAQDLPTD